MLWIVARPLQQVPIRGEELRAVSNVEEMKLMLREKKAFLRERFKVREIGIFGSWVRNEQKKAAT